MNDTPFLSEDFWDHGAAGSKKAQEQELKGIQRGSERGPSLCN